MEKQTARPMAILFATLFLVMVGFGLVMPILPFLIGKMGGGSIALGIFMSAYSIMQFFFAPFWGRMSDRIGRRPVLLIGLSGYGISLLLYGVVNHLWLLIGIRALSGMVSSATLPTAMAYLADITDGSDRSKSMGLVGAAMGLGMVFGPAIGGWLGHYSLTLPFFVAGGLALLVFLFAFALLPETLKEPSVREAGPGQRARFSLHVYKDPLFVLFAFNFVINFTMALFQATLALLAADKIGFGPKQMGTIFAVIGVIGVIVQGGLIGRLVKVLGDAKLVKLGGWVSALGLLLIPQSNHELSLLLSTAMFMSGSSLMGPTSSSLATKGATKDTGASLGLLQSFGSLGRILGPVTGGVLYGLNMGLPYILGAVMMVLIVLAGDKRIMEYEKVTVQKNV